MKQGWITLLCCLSGVAAAQQPSPGGEWLSYNNGLHGQRYSPLKQIDATNIDRLNLGPVPTIQLNWLQPHEGNIVDFLFRARAFQLA